MAAPGPVADPRGRQPFPGPVLRSFAPPRRQQVRADTGLAPDLLELEITENIALGENTAAIEPLRRLRDLGVRVALDDFGTGYASLSFLTRMPLTDIKIDQTFVRGLPDDPKMVSIVRSLIAMAHHLGLKVIAEGVEATPQVQFLLAENCDEAQGFLFAKPLPATAFAALLESRSRPDAAAATA
jgi:EAL domain-containing protein (putative c-di-GMP-specific phosphodiesterase class I)